MWRDDRVLERQRERGRARRARAARAARPPAAPSRRAAGATRRAGTRPGTRRARTSRSTSGCGRRSRWPSSWAITTRTSRAVNGPSTSVSQRTTRRLAPMPIASAFGSDVSLCTSSTTTGIAADVLALLELRTAARSRGIVEPVGRDEVRGDEREQRARAPTNTGAASSHQRSPTRRASPITIASASAEEHELDAEREPAAEDRLRVAGVREAVPARPPELEHVERQLREPRASAKPSIPSSIPVPIGPAADSRAKRAPRRANATRTASSTSDVRDPEQPADPLERAARDAAPPPGRASARRGAAAAATTARADRQRQPGRDRPGRRRARRASRGAARGARGSRGLERLLARRPRAGSRAGTRR